MNAHGIAVGGDIKQDIVQNFPAGFESRELYRRPQINGLRQGRQKAVHQGKPAAIAQQAARPAPASASKSTRGAEKSAVAFICLSRMKLAIARKDRSLFRRICRPDFNFAEGNLLKTAGHL